MKRFVEYVVQVVVVVVVVVRVILMVVIFIAVAIFFLVAITFPSHILTFLCINGNIFQCGVLPIWIGKGMQCWHGHVIRVRLHRIFHPVSQNSILFTHWFSFRITLKDLVSKLERQEFVVIRHGHFLSTLLAVVDNKV